GGRRGRDRAASAAGGPGVARGRAEPAAARSGPSGRDGVGRPGAGGHRVQLGRGRGAYRGAVRGADRYQAPSPTQRCALLAVIRSRGKGSCFAATRSTSPFGRNGLLTWTLLWSRPPGEDLLAVERGAGREGQADVAGDEEIGRAHV